MSYKVACQTPTEYCGAPFCEVNNNLLGQSRPRKLHASHEEAFNCYCAHLIRTGHERVGGREFRAPGGGIVLMSKQTRYGARFRTGKASQGKGGKRFVPDNLFGTTTNGVIIG